LSARALREVDAMAGSGHCFEGIRPADLFGFDFTMKYSRLARAAASWPESLEIDPIAKNKLALIANPKGGKP
jgi:hypothetical protein